jgi:hypothetical protein
MGVPGASHCATPTAPHRPRPTLAALSDTEALKERKLGALRTALGMYRDRLGLAFEHTDGEGRAAPPGLLAGQGQAGSSAAAARGFGGWMWVRAPPSFPRFARG